MVSAAAQASVLSVMLRGLNDVLLALQVVPESQSRPKQCCKASVHLPAAGLYALQLGWSVHQQKRCPGLKSVACIEVQECHGLLWEHEFTQASCRT